MPEPFYHRVQHADGSVSFEEAEVLEGGGMTAGAPIYRKFPFAYNTPDILTGAPLYTPTVGDFLLDAWVEIDTAWDGTSPQLDVGRFSGDTDGEGWWKWAGPGGALDASRKWDENLDLDTGFLTAGTSWSDGGSLSPVASQALDLTWGAQAFTVDAVDYSQMTQGLSQRAHLPAKFLTDDPIKVLVSRNGQVGGADPGSSQGEGVLYLVTVTPA